MTNTKYLKENDLFDAHKHFMRLAEAYMPMTEENLTEAENDEQDPNAEPNADPNAMGADPMAGGDPNAMGGGPNAMGGDPNAMGGDPNAMGADPMAGGDPNADPNAMGADPMAGGDLDMGMEDPNMSGDAELNEGGDEDDENTIDIEGLTKAEDKLNIKQNQIGRDLSKVDSRISTLIGAIEKLQAKLDSNNDELEALKAEFEKRNPTQTEKLNLRSLDSYPFNVRPSDYWAEKARQGGYEAYANNDEPTTKEYKITNDDVDDPDKDIASTFFSIEDDDIQTLDKLFNLH